MVDDKKITASSAASDSRRQLLRATVKSCVDTYFAGTLKQCDDIVNIFMALMYKESSFNVNAVGKRVGTTVGTGGYAYLNYGPIKNALAIGTKPVVDNINQGVIALGLAQSMGWNHVRGAGKSGKCLIEEQRPDLAGRLCVNPGDSIAGILLGDSNIENAVLSGLVVLESKWKACRQTSKGWSIGGKLFDSRIYASVAAYLGLSAKGDANHTTYNVYASQIVGGSAYQVANGSSAPQIRDSNTQYALVSGGGPTVKVTGKGAPTGCVHTENTDPKPA